MFKKTLLCVLYLSFVPPANAASDLIGNWTSADQKVRYDFLEGFAPKMGVVIQYKNGKPDSVSKWQIKPDGIKIDYSTTKYKVSGNSLMFGKTKLIKSEPKGSEAIVELKKDSVQFIEKLVGSNWLHPINQESFRYLKGFSSTSGIYSTTKKGIQESLSSWSFANGVIKIAGSVYPNGRVSSDYLFLLTSNDAIRLFKRGKKAQILETVELKDKGKIFIKKLNSGRWMTKDYSGIHYSEFRPIFGDLSGVIFKLNGSNFIGSESWEYSLKTGSIKFGYTKYVNAQIQGPFLLLLKKNGGTSQMIRPKNETIKIYSHADIKQIKVTETDTGVLKFLLARQWYNHPYTYKFVFKKTGKEGWLHKFRSYPFVISGNTLNIKGLSKVKTARFIDKKIVLGNDTVSYMFDSKTVYLAHQGEEEATKIAQLQKQKTQDSERKKLVLIIKTRDGAIHRIKLPVGEMKNIISLSVKPGL